MSSKAGKPHAEIYRRALALAAGVRGQPIDPARVLAIGDSAHTDIKGGEAQGFDTLFITSGIHRAELHAQTGAGPLDAGGFASISRSSRLCTHGHRCGIALVSSSGDGSHRETESILALSVVALNGLTM